MDDLLKAGVDLLKSMPSGVELLCRNCGRPSGIYDECDRCFLDRLESQFDELMGEDANAARAEALASRSAAAPAVEVAEAAPVEPEAPPPEPEPPAAPPEPEPPAPPPEPEPPAAPTPPPPAAESAPPPPPEPEQPAPEPEPPAPEPEPAPEPPPPPPPEPPKAPEPAPSPPPKPAAKAAPEPLESDDGKPRSIPPPVPVASGVPTADAAVPAAPKRAPRAKRTREKSPREKSTRESAPRNPSKRLLVLGAVAGVLAVIACFMLFTSGDDEVAPPAAVPPAADTGQQTGEPPIAGVIGIWSGRVEVRYETGVKDNLDQEVNIARLEEGGQSGFAHSTQNGGTCKGPLTFSGLSGDSYVFDYRELNTKECIADGVVTLTPTSDTEMQFKEVTDSSVNRGTLSRG